MLEIFDELIDGQKKLLLELAQTLVPHVDFDDLLQPFDFPVLENHPGFRYEEGVLAGLMTARMAMACEFARNTPESKSLSKGE